MLREEPSDLLRHGAHHGGLYGYTPDEIGKMDGTSVLCYGGEEMPESVFVPSYGPRSKRD